eukprot:3384663-Alexandrium_andersonii.AAC.1
MALDDRHVDDLVADALRPDKIPTIYLTGKARAREFRFKEMDYDTRKGFERAMTSEWQSFQNFDALRP